MVAYVWTFYGSHTRGQILERKGRWVERMTIAELSEASLLFEDQKCTKARIFINLP